MAEPRGNLVTLPHRRYHLEPGNGVWYNFSITWLAASKDDLVKVVPSSLDPPYVTITSHNPNEPGTYEFMMHAVGEWERHIDYFCGKMPHVSKEDVQMVMRACSVLIDRPRDVVGAMARMMEV